MDTIDLQTAKQKVLSWIENEERCVTTQRIAQALNLSRLRASQLLEEVSKEQKDVKFHFTSCQRQELEEDSIPVTVFRLRQSTTAQDNLVALAPVTATESIATAHERDLLEWREMVEDGRYKEETEHDAAIQPAEAIIPIKDVLAPRASKLTPVDEIPTAASTVVSSSNLSSNRHKAFSGKAKKVTTAASFFANHKGKNGSSASEKLSQPGKSTTANSSKSDNGSSANIIAKPPKPMLAKENKVRSNQVAPVESDKTKKNSKTNIHKNFKAPTTGNADDFVGDEEESDDDDEIKARQHKQAARRKAVQEANRQSEEAWKEVNPAEDDDDDDKAKVVGAMDTFATTVPKKPTATANNTDGTRQRKRRKKLVEETVMVNGYLRTETKAVWEDVPTDEEEEEKEQERKRVAAKQASAPTNNKKGQDSSKSSSQQGMKQKSLMGFFSKK